MIANQYDGKNQTIIFHAIESTDTMVTKVRVLKYDKKHLKLDFDGDVREFRISDKEGGYYGYRNKCGYL